MYALLLALLGTPPSSIGFVATLCIYRVPLYNKMPLSQKMHIVPVSMVTSCGYNQQASRSLYTALHAFCVELSLPQCTHLYLLPLIFRPNCLPVIDEICQRSINFAREAIGLSYE